MSQLKWTSALLVSIFSSTALASSPPLGEAFHQSLAKVVQTRKALKSATVARSKAQVAAGIIWIKIPGTASKKKFLMGSDNGSSGTELAGLQPAHAITVASFEMAKTAVTNKQYASCVKAGACTPTLESCVLGARDEEPVVCVTWAQAEAFAEWVGGRLPSEAEREYAARSAGEAVRYPWGDDAPTCDKAVYYGCGFSGPQPVCSKPAGNTKQGLCDMAGNVWEWTRDAWHDNYQGAPATAKAWEEGADAIRVIRGGSWSFDAAYVRSALRIGIDAGARSNALGFRPVRPILSKR